MTLPEIRLSASRVYAHPTGMCWNCIARSSRSMAPSIGCAPPATRCHGGRDMPITYTIATYTIDVPTALIITRCVGHVTLAEVQEHFRELPSIWPPVDRLDVLLDLTEQLSMPTLGDLEEAASELHAQIG